MNGNIKTEKKTQVIEIWDNTEENKCVHSFELKNGDLQQLSIRKHNKPRSNVFIDITTNAIKIITKTSTITLYFEKED